MREITEIPHDCVRLKKLFLMGCGASAHRTDVSRVAVGKGGTPYPGYRKVTFAEFTDSDFAQQLVEEHARHGWPLLEPMACATGLYVAEGIALCC